ncbi:MAG: Asp-tRNA(Asn)/Glu-tRNA(Gln) amidotransferase subunit GatC [Rhodospirillaceae bacterium]|nr:Asp-tRNA(Asn)/Glu-tRNA(Gln) amidotransferase subunit GatC [Rhodospirillaceae bacterium]
MSLDSKTVARIATLARIRVPETDLPGLAQELSGIMTWIEQLNEVDTRGVQPMSGVLARDMPRRADVVNDGGDPQKVLANAPEPAHGFFTVPKVIE